MYIDVCIVCICMDVKCIYARTYMTTPCMYMYILHIRTQNIYACIHMVKKCAYVYIHGCKHTYIQAYTHVCIFTCMYIYIYIYIYIQTCKTRAAACLFERFRIETRFVAGPVPIERPNTMTLCVCVYACVHVCMYTQCRLSGQTL